MSIRLNALNNYANAGRIANVNKSKTGAGKSVSSGKTVADSISISAGASDYNDIARVQSGISADISSLSSSEYVQAIKAQVASGEYNVSSDAIAGSILDRFA